MTVHYLIAPMVRTSSTTARPIRAYPSFVARWTDPSGYVHGSDEQGSGFLFGVALNAKTDTAWADAEASLVDPSTGSYSTTIPAGWGMSEHTVVHGNMGFGVGLQWWRVTRANRLSTLRHIEGHGSIFKPVRGSVGNYLRNMQKPSIDNPFATYSLTWGGNAAPVLCIATIDDAEDGVRRGSGDGGVQIFYCERVSPVWISLNETSVEDLVSAAETDLATLESAITDYKASPSIAGKDAIIAAMADYFGYQDFTLPGRPTFDGSATVYMRRLADAAIDYLDANLP